MAITTNSPTQLLAIRATITTAADADYLCTVTRAINIVDAAVTKGPVAAGGASTIQLMTAGAAAISNAININVAADILVRAGVISDATSNIAAAGTILFRALNAGNGACDVITYCIPG